MVCVLPEHRGANLSYALCLAVLHRFRERGLKQMRLHTGDWRLGAVKTSLKLGFQPLPDSRCLLADIDFEKAI
jgi:mycothiol synthase